MGTPRYRQIFAAVAVALSEQANAQSPAQTLGDLRQAFQSCLNQSVANQVIADQRILKVGDARALVENGFTACKSEDDAVRMALGAVLSPSDARAAEVAFQGFKLRLKNEFVTVFEKIQRMK